MRRPGCLLLAPVALLVLLLGSFLQLGAARKRHLGQVIFPQPPMGPVPPSPADILSQRKAIRSLMRIKAAFNNHPAFNGIPGNPTNPFNNKVIATAAWDPTTLPCEPSTWAWLACVDNRVAELNLAGAAMSVANKEWQATGEQPLTGVLDFNDLEDLSDLTRVFLDFQIINGTMGGVSKLPKLRELSMTNNRFTGPIPDEISKLTNLTRLKIDMNYLSGSLPSALSTLVSLEYLQVGSTGINGPFPDWLGNLERLKLLGMLNSAIVGSLPDAWSKLTALTTMQLGGTTISGTIPPSWSSMTSLVNLGMFSCNLKATYPAVLTRMTQLKAIALSGNQMHGTIPTNVLTDQLTSLYLDQNYFNGSIPAFAVYPNPALDIRLDLNCFNGNLSNYSPRPAGNCSAFYATLYASPAPPAGTTVVQSDDGSTSTSSSNSKLVIIICVVVAAVVAAALALLGYFYWRSTRRNKFSKLFTKGLRQTSREFTLPELKAATQNWGSAIGKGGYGTVYKAELKDGSFVAVKRLDQVSKQGDQEFIREVELLSRVHHRHLVNLLGFCAERGERALIYEYMAMGSLFEHLHGESAKQFPLSWDSRCKIAIHVALGIEYLHYGADPPLIHRDIKSANILLSDDGYSKVADFGLCKEAPVGAAADGSEQLVPTATAVRGSFGYLDPEYVNTSILSEKSDVYSYGVVLLELITGHKSIHDWQPLAYWAEEYLADREKTPMMVDPALEGNFDVDELYALCDIARTCVQDQSLSRPTIRDVAKALVENLGHAMSSFTGSQQDSASIGPSSQSDASSMPSTTYTPSSASVDESADGSAQFSYQNYSATLQWTPTASGEVAIGEATGLTVSKGPQGDRPAVPVPKKPKRGGKKAKKEEGGGDGLE